MDVVTRDHQISQTQVPEPAMMKESAATGHGHQCSLVCRAVTRPCQDPAMDAKLRTAAATQE